jgi:hypothetical protein
MVRGIAAKSSASYKNKPGRAEHLDLGVMAEGNKLVTEYSKSRDKFIMNPPSLPDWKGNDPYKGAMEQRYGIQQSKDNYKK